LSEPNLGSKLDVMDDSSLGMWGVDWELNGFLISLVSVLFANGSWPKMVVLENGRTFDLREMLGSMMLGGAIRAFSLANSKLDSSVLDDLGLLPDLLIGWAFTGSFLTMSFSSISKLLSDATRGDFFDFDFKDSTSSSLSSDMEKSSSSVLDFSGDN